MVKPGRQKMVICGNYGAGNVGDEAILRALLQEYRPRYDVTVMSANPIETSEKFKVSSILQLPSGVRSRLKHGLSRSYRSQSEKAKQAIKECDVFLLGGGTLITDEPWQSMVVWGAPINFALRQNRRFWVVASGIGPLRSASSQRKAQRWLSRAEKITVRDGQSRQWANRLGIRNVQVVPDPVFGLKWSRTKGGNPRNNTVIFVPRFWTKNMNNLVDELKKFAHYLKEEKGKNLIGVPFEKESKKDRLILNKIFDQAGGEMLGEIWTSYDSELDVLNKMASAECVVGMRLHSLIFAEITQTPFVGIAYSEKVTALGQELHKSKQIVPLEKITVQALIRAYNAAEKTSS